MVEPLWRCLVQLMHMEMVAVIWSLGDDFDGAVEMLDDGPLMESTLIVPCMDDVDPLMVIVELELYSVMIDGD